MRNELVKPVMPARLEPKLLLEKPGKERETFGVKPFADFHKMNLDFNFIEVNNVKDDLRIIEMWVGKGKR